MIEQQKGVRWRWLVARYIGLHRTWAIATLLLVTMICRAGGLQTEVLQIEGFYRFGHEVNTICSGEPEACYWLLDTDAEVRQHLKQQVAGLAPYTPVCLNLVAEISAEKADGFGRDYDGSIRVHEVLGRCCKETLRCRFELRTCSIGAGNCSALTVSNWTISPANWVLMVIMAISISAALARMSHHLS
jgi:hypothetical protein